MQWSNKALDQNEKKTLSAGPLLVLDVPTTKDGPGCFILICPMLHVYHQPTRETYTQSSSGFCK
jgi:hypothetical protein